MLNGWRLPILNNPILAFITTVIVFGGLLSLIYTFIFNRTTRQGIHDLVVGSYVVPAPPAPEMVRPEIPRIHRRFTYGLVGVGLLLGIAGLAIQAVRPSGFVTLEEGELAELTELQTALMDTGEFYSVNVVRQNRRSLQGGDVLRDLNIDMWAKRTCLGNPDYCNETVAWAARTAFEYFDGIEDLSGMRVAVVNRFDLGITSGTLSQGAAWSIEDWHQELVD
jgi:hypothetical protein